MVVFTCQHCGEAVKKTSVEKHYNTICRFKSPYLTCVDCLKDFSTEDYRNHNQCMTENERYSATGTVIKELKGKKKQERYIEMIKSILNRKDLTDAQRKLLQVCSEHDNVPRKLPKFQNFIMNVARHVKCKPEDVKTVFHILDDAWKECQGTQNASGQNKEQNSLGNVHHKNITENEESLNERRKESISDLSKKDLHKSKKKQQKDKNLTDQEIIENIDVVSKKKQKKQRKYEKYLAELEKESSSEKHNAGVSHSESSPFTDSKNSSNIMEPIPKLETKKNKKRKLVETVLDNPPKKIKDINGEGEEKADTFHWGNVIVQVLQTRPEKELSLKKLGKKVVNHYQTVKPDHRSYEELLAKFNKKVHKTKGVQVLRDRAKLV